MLIGSLLKRFLNPSFDSWVGVVAVMAFIAARVGFVFRHWDSYQHNPLRILYIWQGGFDMSWAVVGALLSLLFLKTWRYRLIGVAALSIAAVSIFIAYNFTPKPGADNLPDIALQSINKEMINLADYADAKVVINIWASWCGPCRREMPMLEQAVADYPDIKFLFINQGEPEQLVSHYLTVEALQLSDNVLLDQTQEIPRYYKTLGTPVTMFFDSNKLLATDVGEISAELLSDRIKQLKP
ncbi:MAG: TlpA disulfide reductase family protein [Alcaligenaceae bacterium]|nr:TlpA disulfide reductase family protein [Alcaligenaceae bacterium]